MIKYNARLILNMSVCNMSKRYTPENVLIDRKKNVWEKNV